MRPITTTLGGVLLATAASLTLSAPGAGAAKPVTIRIANEPSTSVTEGACDGLGIRATTSFASSFTVFTFAPDGTFESVRGTGTALVSTELVDAGGASLGGAVLELHTAGLGSGTFDPVTGATLIEIRGRGFFGGTGFVVGHLRFTLTFTEAGPVVSDFWVTPNATESLCTLLAP